MSDPTRCTLAELETELEASEAETGPGIPLTEIEAKIEAAIERAELVPPAGRRLKAVPGRSSN
jgi:hypothetical protein